MSYTTMYVLLLYIIASHVSCGGLLSRTKIGHEYAPPPDSIILPSDWRQETYEDIADMSELRERSTVRLVSDLRFTQQTQPVDLSDEYFDTTQLDLSTELEERENENSPRTHPTSELISQTTNSSRSSWRSPWRSSTTNSDVVTTGDRNLTLSTRRDTFNSSARFIPDPTKSGRRWLLDWFGPIGTQTGICYVCGLFHWDIPVSPYCYAAFESDDWRQRTFARYSRCECYRSIINYSRQKTFYYSWWNYRTTDRGLKTQYFNRKFIEGCFKRWTDIGTAYHQRGCRRHWPWTNSQTFADHRYWRLEVMLRRLKQGCIASTHASLLPYARGISLYTRFHVCVCNTRYCNGEELGRAPSARLLACMLAGALILRASAL